jgi:phosphoribosylformylglycinamidine synthase I
MKSAIVIFPGTNRERDMASAIEKVSGKKPRFIWYNDNEIPIVDLLILPGGFAYGDYLRAGAMAARAPIARAVVDHASKGGAILGVCNGFQILTEIGLLPGVLMRNSKLKFICCNLNIRVEMTGSMFTSKYSQGQCLSIPVAHNDGNYFADKQTLDKLEEESRVAFRYVDETGETTSLGNPNGSARNIAGIFNKRKNILGFMPHPENATDDLLGGTDGHALFESIVDTLS